MTKPFFIYLHRRPDTGDVFYVGRGKSYRNGSNIRRAEVSLGRSKSWKSIVDRNNGVYAIEIAEWVDTFEDAKEREVFYIKSFGLKRDGGTLINQTYGGDGIDGYCHTEDAKEKLKDAWLKNPQRKDFLKSEKFLSARRKKMESCSGPMTGKKHTQETLAKYREQRTGSKNSQARKVINRLTGEEFGCVGDAARSVGLSQYTLYNYLLGNAKNTTPLEYK